MPRVAEAFSRFFAFFAFVYLASLVTVAELFILLLELIPLSRATRKFLIWEYQHGVPDIGGLTSSWGSYKNWIRLFWSQTLGDGSITRIELPIKNWVKRETGC